jgi:hypothetical protein
MRVVLVIAVLLWVSGVEAQEKKPPKRYLISANLEAFPQDTPKKALDSVIKAILDRKVDYLLAHLADPKFVDLRVQLYDKNFDALVKDTTDYLNNDPTILKEMKLFAKKGEWDVKDDRASASLEEKKSRRMFFRKIEGRWFLENEQQKSAK